MGLDELRKKIDEIDKQLIALMNARAEIVVDVGNLKRETGDVPIYAPDREKDVLAKICNLNEGPLPDKTVQAVWRELMSGSFFLERPLRISFLGPEGSYSHQASMKKFGQSVEYIPLKDIKGVFNEVARSQCDFGVVPVENSSGGGVIETLDAFLETSIMICAEMEMPIHHNLLAKCPLEQVEKIYSKPEVFTQCRNWINENNFESKIITEASTAKAAKLASETEACAAIGSALAGHIYNLNVLYENIEDNPENITRFLIIARHDTPRTGDDKTAIVFTTPHKPGALFDVLGIFDKYDINLTRIESRPNKTRNWEYHFFADLLGHKTDNNILKAINKLREKTIQVQILGSFPRYNGEI